MEGFRSYYCSCSGTRIPLVYDPTFEEEPDEVTEPHCPKCGASPSSDPKHVIGFRDQQTFRE